MRADQLLVQRGLAASRSQAQRLIAAGLRWRVGGGVSPLDAGSAPCATLSLPLDAD